VTACTSRIHSRTLSSRCVSNLLNCAHRSAKFGKNAFYLPISACPARTNFHFPKCKYYTSAKRQCVPM